MCWGPTLEEIRARLARHIQEAHRYEAMTPEQQEAYVQELWRKADDAYWGDPRWDRDD